MTPLKLMSHSGEVLGAVIVPEAAEAILRGGKSFVFHYVPPVAAFAPPSPVQIGHNVMLAPYYRGDDAVMLMTGDLWTFEKIPGCIFIPGYAFARKGCR